MESGKRHKTTTFYRKLDSTFLPKSWWLEDWSFFIDCCTLRAHSPVQFTWPFPVNPFLHVHRNDPFVSLQVAFDLQSWRSPEHCPGRSSPEHSRQSEKWIRLSNFKIIANLRICSIFKFKLSWIKFKRNPCIKYYSEQRIIHWQHWWCQPKEQPQESSVKPYLSPT